VAAVDHKLHERTTTLTLFCFFYSVIFIHKLDIIRKEYVIPLKIFSVAMLYQILLKSVNI